MPRQAGFAASGELRDKINSGEVAEWPKIDFVIPGKMADELEEIYNIMSCQEINKYNGAAKRRRSKSWVYRHIMALGIQAYKEGRAYKQAIKEREERADLGEIIALIGGVDGGGEAEKK